MARRTVVPTSALCAAGVALVLVPVLSCRLAGSPAAAGPAPQPPPAAQPPPVRADLLAAVRGRQAEEVHRLLEAGADPNVRDSQGRTPLLVGVDDVAMPAQAANYYVVPLGIMEDLLAHHADPSIADRRGRSPVTAALDGGPLEVAATLVAASGKRLDDPHEALSLSWAIRRRDTDAVRRLLAAGADPNAADQSGTTALHRAARFGSREAVDLLLAKGADPNATNREGETPLLLASPSTDVPGILLAAGARANAHDVHGRTPLRAAVWQPDLKLAEELLRRGADPNVADERGETVLYAMVYQGRLAPVELLLAHHANPNVVAADGSTAVWHAVQHADVLAALLKAGGDPNGPRSSGTSPLEMALQVQNPADERFASARILLEHGADPNAVDRGGAPLLYRAIWGRVDLLPLMVRRGARLNTQDRSGITPLSTAIQTNRVDAVRALLELGADPNLPDKGGWTPLATAVSRRSEESVRLLLRHGARLDPAGDSSRRAFTFALDVPGDAMLRLLLASARGLPRDPGHDTLLTGAIIRRRADLIPVLVKAGADPNAGDAARNGQVPLVVAAVNPDVAVLKALLDCGARPNGDPGGYPPLLAWAGRSAPTEGLALLLKRGADPRRHTRDGDTALGMAAMAGDAAAMALLVKAGAGVEDENGIGRTPLMLATDTGNVDAMRWLLAHGAKVNHRGRFGETALAIAGHANRPDVLDVLRRAGARP